ncbi:MAG: hypothetical protein AAGE52_39880 [Myxococcota bacterium]
MGVGTEARFDVRGFLRYRGSARLDALGLALKRPRILWQIANVPHRHELAFESPRVEGRHIRGTALIGRRWSLRRIALEEQRVPCEWLAITTAPLRATYNAGFESEPLPDEPRVDRRVWNEGRQDGRRHTAAEPEAERVDAPDRFQLSRPRRGSPIGLRSGSALVWILDRRGPLVRVLLQHGHSTVTGWTNAAGFSPREGYGRGEGGFRGRSARVPRVGPRHLARLRRNAEVFAAPREGEAPWAHVAEGDLVEVDPGTDGWTRLVVIPGVRLDEEVAWVRDTDVEERFHETSCGTFVILGTSGQRRFRVHHLPPMSALARRGARVGDEFGDSHVLHCSRFPWTLWVWREGNPLPLRESE